MKNNSVCGILLAAGSGKRMNVDVKKQFIEVNNKPLIYYSIKTLSECENINEIIIVTSNEDINFMNEIVKKYNFKKVTVVTKGGSRRQDSVLNGLKCVPEEYTHVLIHDGARPFVKKEDIINVINDGVQFDSAALGVKVKDTIKEIDDSGFVKVTHNRDYLISIQTPQVVNKTIILEGFLKFNDKEFTDDTSILELSGVKTKITPGSYSNIKITTNEDLIYLKDLI